MKNLKAVSFLLLFLIPTLICDAYWVWSPEQGKFVNPEGGSQDVSDEAFDYANQLYKDKNLDDALEQLDDLLKKHPNSHIAPEAQYLMGVINEEKRDYYKAFQAYRKLLEVYPHSERQDEVIEREFRIANLFLSGRKAKLMGLEILPSLPKAVEVFEHIVLNAPYSEFGDEAQFRLGVAYKKSGKFAEAMEAFQSVVDNYPQSDLVTEARYQLAETAFSRSNVQARDERALESAAHHVDRFLMRYPDANVTEKAAKLRQEIDEKNAERNYRIALYYEKDKYLSSALLYYRDVAKRYPHTKWGVKSKEKLASLQEPVEYITDKEEKLESQIQLVQAQLDAEGLEKIERESLEGQLKRLKERDKLLDKSKTESLKSREDDIKRREYELKEKAMKLAEKRELYKDNKSEDFLRAMERWELSLEDERQRLENEKQQLIAWKESLGIATRDPLWNFVPFTGGHESELDKVRSIGTKQLYKVSDEKKTLLEEKEYLYKQHHQVSEMLGRQSVYFSEAAANAAYYNQTYDMSSESLGSRRDALNTLRSEIEALETQLEQKNKAYQDKFGESAWQKIVKAPVRAFTVPTAAVGRTFQNINPFASDSRSLEDMSEHELMEKRLHLKEKIAAQHALVEILSQAFDEELAMQEHKRLLASLEDKSEIDVRQLRKEIKGVEKEIRLAYTEIGDRHDDIKILTKELDATLKQKDRESGAGRIGSVLALPGKTVLKSTKDFFFGRKPEEVVLSQEAKKLDANDAVSAKAKAIQQEIELYSMVIEARNREIYQLQKNLEILQTKASLAGGYKFRSSMVGVPYEFIDEAIESAREMLPKQDRKEEVLKRLDVETQDLERFKAELKQVESALAKTAGSSAPAVAVNADAAVEESAADASVEEVQLQQEIQSVSQQLEMKIKKLEHENQLLKHESKAMKREIKDMAETVTKDDQKAVKSLTKNEKKLEKELKSLEKDLVELIERETDLENKEVDILEDRINKIDQLVQRVHSKAVAQDLLTERNRMEERLQQIDERRNFLSQELSRFDPAKMKVA